MASIDKLCSQTPKVLAEIFSYLTREDKKSCRLVCRFFYNSLSEIDDPYLWIKLKTVFQVSLVELK